jgi:hypothetical protein
MWEGSWEVAKEPAGDHDGWVYGQIWPDLDYPFSTNAKSDLMPGTQETHYSNTRRTVVYLLLSKCLKKLGQSFA